MRRCCVIGGTGFIGSRLVNRLIEEGRSVTVVGRRTVPAAALPPDAKYYSGDYGDNHFIKQILPGHDEVILLAHTTVPKTSYDDPVSDILSNVPAAVSLFELCSILDFKKIVFISSGGTVYGRAQYLPIREDHPTNPLSPYGLTKLTIEKYALMYRHLKSLPVVCVRPGNAYGEGQRPFVGQGFIATAMGSILEGKEIQLFGECGTVRDYIHVNDVVEGIMAALDRGVPGECYNVGSGQGRNNLQILESLKVLADSLGLTVRCSILPDRPFDVPTNILDSGKLRIHTGFVSNVKFEDGLRLMWRWFVEGFNQRVVR